MAHGTTAQVTALQLKMNATLIPTIQVSGYIMPSNCVHRPMMFMMKCSLQWKKLVGQDNKSFLAVSEQKRGCVHIWWLLLKHNVSGILWPQWSLQN